MQKSYVYIISNKHDTVLYIGVTSNLKKRIYEHKNHVMSGFTDQYFCEKLLYFEEYLDIKQAIQREKQLKNWRREWKDQLIKNVNPDFVDLMP